MLENICNAAKTGIDNAKTIITELIALFPKKIEILSENNINNTAKTIPNTTVYLKTKRTSPRILDLSFLNNGIYRSNALGVPNIANAARIDTTAKQIENMPYTSGPSPLARSILYRYVKIFEIIVPRSITNAPLAIVLYASAINIQSHLFFKSFLFCELMKTFKN